MSKFHSRKYDDDFLSGISVSLQILADAFVRKNDIKIGEKKKFFILKH